MFIVENFENTEKIKKEVKITQSSNSEVVNISILVYFFPVAYFLFYLILNEDSGIIWINLPMGSKIVKIFMNL